MDEFLKAMAPVTALEGDDWDAFLEDVEQDEAISDAIVTSRAARLEPQLYKPFATIANRITELFKKRCGELVKRPIKFFGPGSSYIRGSPSYDNGQPVTGTESQRKPDGLALLAEELGDARFGEHKKGTPGAEEAMSTLDGKDGGDLSMGWRRSILAVEHNSRAKWTSRSSPCQGR